MKIALDYDETYTRDPEFWDQFIDLASDFGHDVTCVTMRRPQNKIEGLQIDVIYTSFKGKILYTQSLGIQFDIWIDDNPIWLLNDVPTRDNSRPTRNRENDFPVKYRRARIK